MCKKLIYLVSFVLVLSVVLTSTANADDPNLVGWWKFDGDTLDSSGNGRDGVLIDDAHLVEVGIIDGALSLDGSGDYVTIPGYKGINADRTDPNNPFNPAFSIALWIKTTDNEGGFVTWGSNDGTGVGGQRQSFRINAGRLRAEHGNGNLQSDTAVNNGEWHHVVQTTVEGGNLRVPNTILYIDGVEDAIRGGGDPIFNLTEDADVRIGGSASMGGRNLSGEFDDVRLYDRVLDPNEVAELAIWPKSHAPDPGVGALVEDVSVLLGWTPGGNAVEHDVYVGTTAELGADQLLGRQAATSALATGLEKDTMYYWRVDDIAADGTVATGDTWSFWVPPRSSYDPSPADGVKLLDTTATLSWTGGFTPIMHNVHFGTDPATLIPVSMMQMDATYDTGPLENGTTYYWRIDEFYGVDTVEGPVWSFSTVPVLPVSDDPNLVAQWTFDGDSGGVALDQSGNGNHVLLKKGAQVVAGRGGDVLDMGLDGYGAISNMHYDVNNAALPEITVSCWIRTDSEADQYILSFDRDENFRLEINGNGAGPGQVGWDVMTLQDGAQSMLDYGSVTRVDDGEWHHVAGIFDNGTSTIYIDGFAEPSATGGPVFGTGETDTRYGFIGDNSEATSFDGSNSGGTPVGAIDDLCIYDRAFSEDEMRQTFGNVLLAWKPDPALGATDLAHSTVLSWTPGDDATQHDIYIGTDAQAVTDADASDTTGIYQGQQDLGNESFSPALELEQTYYWRIDEVAISKGKVCTTKGRVWTFAVVDSIVVDDFEDYNDLGPNEIFATWIDGWGTETNGALISNVETGIVHGGAQSMPYFYDNNMKYSEATMTLIDPRDWTEGGAGALSLWYRGYPGSVGGFVEDPAGTYTMTASGADIWGQADEFHFAFKQLPVGPCTIIAKVEGVDLTNNWAKAGVMIRDTLDAGSKFAAVYIMPTNDDGTATNGCSFQARLEADVDAVYDSSVATDEQKVITAPYWVKLERGVIPFFSGYYSSDGVTWVPMSWNPQIIPMDGDIYIGLALTSHDNALTCEAVLSNVEITGTVGAEWTSQDIGISSNAREPMYVSIANQTSPAVAVYNDDPNASTTDTWTEWVINLQDFAEQGVDLTDVDRISIGFGDKDNVQAGGSGIVYIDDIRLYRQPPVAHWKLDDAGTIAVDSSGNGNDGTLIGDPQWATGIIGGALELDGVDDYVDCGNPSMLDFGTGDFTISAWIKMTSSERGTIWANGGDDSGGIRYTLSMGESNDDRITILVDDNDDKIRAEGATLVTDGVWHHVVGMREGTTLRVCVDGIYEDGINDLPVGYDLSGTSQKNALIGAIWSQGDDVLKKYFTGLIDDVRIYDRALPEAEILELAGQ